MRSFLIAAVAMIAAPALAQPATNGPATVDVSGHGQVSVPPDTANLHYWLRGEGKTPDDATRDMVAAQKSVETGLRGFLGADAKITNSQLVVIEVRDPSCKTDQGQPQLSEGKCAIIGYLATSETDVATQEIAKAGTAVGLASRLGARDSRLQGYELRDTTAAQRTAMIEAVNDAHQQATILATAAGGHLGRAMSIQYGSYAHPMAQFRMVASPAPPPPPVEIDMKPRPQDVTADVSVSYELLP